MNTILGVAVVFAIIVVSSLLPGLMAARTKRKMQCLYVESGDLVPEVRSTLEDADIYFSDMIWSPSQTAYNQIGAAQRPPGEIWIQKSDLSRVKQVLSLRYKIEVTDSAIIVREDE